MVSSPGAVFLFGKLPAHGDFVARGLSESARQAWDDWASSAMEQLRLASDDFEAAHEASPPWRFIAGHSRIGDGWRCGALAASVDGAGRRFVVVAGIDNWRPHEAAALGMLMAEATETLLYRALSEGLTADETVQELTDELGVISDQQEAADALAAQPAGSGVWWSASSGLDARLAADPPTDLFAAACAPDPRSTAA